MGDLFSVGLSGHDTISLLKSIVMTEIVNRNRNVRVHFDYGDAVGNGITYDNVFPVEIFVGVRELNTDAIVSDSQIMESIRAVYHELRHADHKLTKFGCCNDFKSEMKIDYIACDKNSWFYGYRYNNDLADDYWSNIREIDCERYALRRTYVFLKDYVDGMDAKMVDFVNNKLFEVHSVLGAIPKGVDYYFRQNVPYESWDSMNARFDKVLSDCVVRGHQNYSVRDDPGSVLSYALKRNSNAWLDCRIAFNGERNGFRKNCMAASIMLNMRREYIDELGITDNEQVLMDFKSLFGRSFPKISFRQVHKKFSLSKELNTEGIRRRLERSFAFDDVVSDDKDNELF